MPCRKKDQTLQAFFHQNRTLQRFTLDPGVRKKDQTLHPILAPNRTLQRMTLDPRGGVTIPHFHKIVRTLPLCLYQQTEALHQQELIKQNNLEL